MNSDAGSQAVVPDSAPLGRGCNVELKARLHDFAAAREIARELATEYVGYQNQVDTYFNCTRGRLKLREIEGQTAQLVSYERPDHTEARASDYCLVPVEEPALLKQALSASLGVLTVVSKRREIFLHHNVRIHLDEVAGQGTFIEFEAVLGPDYQLPDCDRPGVDREQGAAQVAFLRSCFGLQPVDLLQGSYSDLP